MNSTDLTDYIDLRYCSVKWHITIELSDQGDGDGLSILWPKVTAYTEFKTINLDTAQFDGLSRFINCSYYHSN